MKIDSIVKIDVDIFFHFCIFTCSAELSMFHMEKRSRNTLIIIIIKKISKLLLSHVRTRVGSLMFFNGKLRIKHGDEPLKQMGSR